MFIAKQRYFAGLVGAEVTGVAFITVTIISIYAMHLCNKLGPGNMWTDMTTAGQQTVQRARWFRTAYGQRSTSGQQWVCGGMLMLMREILAEGSISSI